MYDFPMQAVSFGEVPPHLLHLFKVDSEKQVIEVTKLVEVAKAAQTS
jgi:hypothetical protein